MGNLALSESALQGVARVIWNGPLFLICTVALGEGAHCIKLALESLHAVWEWRVGELHSRVAMKQ